MFPVLCVNLLITYHSFTSISPHRLSSHKHTEIFIGSVIATKLAVWVDKTEEEKQVEVEMTKEKEQRGEGAAGKGREVEGKEGEDERLEKGMYAGEEEEGDEEDDDEMFGVS